VDFSSFCTGPQYPYVLSEIPSLPKEVHAVILEGLQDRHVERYENYNAFPNDTKFKH
jgi:hypothetical protein